MYYIGDNVKKDYDNAFEWFRKAAENGHEKAEELFKKYDFKN